MPYQASKSSTGKSLIGTEVGAFQVDPNWYEAHWFSERPALAPSILRRVVACVQSGWAGARRRYLARRIVREDETMMVIGAHV